MYSNINQVFENEKLSLMTKPYEDKDMVYFPNHINPKISCSIDSPLALGISTILKAGFNLETLQLKQNDDNSVSVIFNNKEIQKLIFKEINTDDPSKEISNHIKSDIKKSNADKTTYVFFDKKTFLKQENALGSYLRTIGKFTENSELDIFVEDLRIMLLAQSGIYIEEYENKKNILQPEDILNPLLINHHNTFSTQIILDVKNYNEIKDSLTEAELGRINIVTNMKYGANTPIYSFNPILNVSNYRDLELKEIADNKIFPFLDTLILQATDYYSAEKAITTESNPYILKELKSIMSYSLNTDGADKKLYSLRPQMDLIAKGLKEILVYSEHKSDKNIVCISSKGSCLGNGQHSTSTFKILNLLLHCDDNTNFILKEKYDCNETTLANLFQTNSKGSVYKAVQKKLFDIIEASGLKVEEFLSFLDKTTMNINWEIGATNTVLTRKVINDNTQTSQSKNDEWLNTNKSYMVQLLAKYHKVNSEEIIDFFQIKKDPSHPLYKFQTTLQLKGIKTLDLSSPISHSYSTPVKINDIYPYIALVCPSNKNNSPIDSPYTEIPNLLHVESRGNLRNIYQKDTLNNNLYKLWNDIFSLEKPEGKATFESFISFLSSEKIAKQTKQIKKNNKFLELGNKALNNDYALKKIPAIILYQNMAQYYFNKIKDTLPKDAININNFTSLAFHSYLHKLGKGKDTNSDGFTLNNIKENGELILMDISNSLHKYYNNENYVITNQLKRAEFQDNPQHLSLAQKLTIELLEPFKDARVWRLDNTESEKLNNIQYQSISECIAAKKDDILEYFDTHIGLDKEFKKLKQKIRI